MVPAYNRPMHLSQHTHVGEEIKPTPAEEKNLSTSSHNNAIENWQPSMGTEMAGKVKPNQHKSVINDKK